MVEPLLAEIARESTRTRIANGHDLWLERESNRKTIIFGGSKSLKKKNKKQKLFYWTGDLTSFSSAPEGRWGRDPHLLRGAFHPAAGLGVRRRTIAWPRFVWSGDEIP